jgi:SAM-dependent methyltransferase
MDGNAEIFDDWPDKDDQWFETPIGRLVKKYESQLVLEMLRPQQGERILDAGCGTGIFTLDVLAVRAQVVGLELSLPMLLLAVGLLLILGYLGGRAAKAVKLPRVSGYLVAGMLLSPSFSDILSRQLINRDLYIITEIALGIIAYLIGGSLILERLKRLGEKYNMDYFLPGCERFLVDGRTSDPHAPISDRPSGSRLWLARDVSAHCSGYWGHFGSHRTRRHPGHNE